MNFAPEVQAKYDRMNLDESKVVPYTLPSPLVGADGKIVKNAVEWQCRQRPYLLELFSEHMYGYLPPRPDHLSFEMLSFDPAAFNGLATRREVAIHCRMNNGREHTMVLLLYIPNHERKPVPAFFGLNFQSNAACTPESDIRLSALPRYNGDNSIYVDTRATADNRGAQAYRWQFKTVLKRGYATGTMYYFDAFPDFPDGFADSIYRLFFRKEDWDAPKCNYSAIGAWAWGIMRAVDYLESVPEIDCRKIIVHGHSRLGKTALWAGACDPRIAMAVSNCSGCGGAKLSRRNFGESLEWLLHWRPYWFARKWQEYIGEEHRLPFDQHSLIALMAPRPVYIDSATEDGYADPQGEFASAVAAGEVYRLFGSNGLGSSVMPAADQLVGDDIGYHIRTGKHDMTEFDWKAIMDFADCKIR